MKITNVVLSLLLIGSAFSYTYDINQPTKAQKALSSKTFGGNDDAQLPYHANPFAYDYDSVQDMYTVYYVLTNDYGQKVTTTFSWVYGTESMYLLKQRLEMNVWIEYEAQAGAKDIALQFYIRNYNARGVVCQ